ncbi:alpha/beta fold hydrolase [Nocardia brasiliensis]|uniref:alpha/beta fold hydrolase n=1 Tax=Nocardia brasiliensis TaxID=37326 RepID=UPI0002E6BD92|nr:alpha/beta fold hydrolase [Nocardia brasiliensis]OCF84767.1 hypothetical protein AW168_39815 [Nocardia brasiliensis]
MIIPHGAWLQPARYDEVTVRLRRDGVDVTVPGLAGRSPAYAASKDTPSTYLAATEDRAIPPELVAHFRRRCETRVTSTGGHCPFLSRPADVVTVLHDHL